MTDWEDIFRRLRKEPEGDLPPFYIPAANQVNPALKSLEKLSEPLIEGDSEKSKVLSSLKDLTEEKQKETGKGIPVPGGNLKLKEEISQNNSLDLEGSQDPKELKVLFVYNYSQDALELEEARRAEAPSEQLLDRMIRAMKMESGDYLKLVISETDIEKFYDFMSRAKVDIVVSMGAVPTGLILGKQERISKVHGKFFDRQLTYRNDQVREFQVVPVFNPELILINPSMKRSAWIDLQKIMKKLGIPTE